MDATRICRDEALPAEGERARPVDLAHLSRYTLGARDLEREVLELFCDQSGVYLEQLSKSASDQHWREAAHSLKGSALAIGAWAVAEAAARAERLSGPALAEGREARLVEIEAFVQEAKIYIRTLF